MKKLFLVSLLLLLLLLSACNTPSVVEEQPASPTPTATITPEPSPTPTETATPTETPPLPTDTPAPTPTPQPYGPDEFPEGINPLTGLPVANPDSLNRRPIGIKVNIFPREQYRPTWGLSFADIVFDYYHNNGYSRFHAILYGNDSELTGAVRSGRLLDEDLVRMYKSIFVYGGASEEIDSVFWNSEFANRLVREGRESLCPPTVENPLCRYEPSGVSNLLAGTLEVHQSIQDKGVADTRQNLSGMLFDLNIPENGKEGQTVTTRYSSDDYNRWDYDPVTGQYLRFQDNRQDQGEGEEYVPLTDRTTEEQISADNVVIVFASHQNVSPKTNQEVFDINLMGTGKALAFRDGQAYEVVWNRPTPDSVLYLTYPDGRHYPYKPGVTWYQVVGIYSQISEEEGGAWRVVIGIP